MKVDYIHFYLDDARVWRDWFINSLNFDSANSFLVPLIQSEHNSHAHTEVVRSGSVCFVLSSPVSDRSPVAKFLQKHPSGVADVAFNVNNVEEAITKAKTGGAKILEPIQWRYQGDKYIKWSKISAWGDLTHTLIERGSLKSDREVNYSSKQFHNYYYTAVDHIVLNIPTGYLKHAVIWYEKVFGFQPQQTFNIQTQHSALHSRVMVSSDGEIQFPINEPASKNSQIQEFLDVNQGPGIQHIALRTNNLVERINQLSSKGLSFLPISQNYYADIQKRVGFPLSSEELIAIIQQQILVDWDEKNSHKLLLQIFTKPIFGEPTFFFEFIERRCKAQGFGEGNFRALFKVMEEEQIKRVYTKINGVLTEE
ncbi:4-hydroxyphenylpyruvate dioxygenase [Mastigocoleus sp. MO_188.B34]|uniref:4-hydroxyphenylpyruvate dioxygenase n=1 Tax=Mastigocoleus sp. MO_188.B34 TaxID=3036635 RepID=UPI00262AE213|nr:4-hydroxyphenylpyruvate dioxygenase [Mastigocoleus sp. MO_188.B34]MDJ0696235.1 4-hydroxyphenylpyruvate dioxygenase [Mastigocoleus sp. MO_188.B34]